MIMRLSEKESLSFLKDNGFGISANHLYRLKRQIQESRFDRLSLIAKHGFVDQHLERIDQLELINKEYWKLYGETKDTFKKALILEKIAELQTFISPYYDASRYILEKSIKSNNETKESVQSISV
jgi:DNA repair ATPase RecN